MVQCVEAGESIVELERSLAGPKDPMSDKRIWNDSNPSGCLSYAQFERRSPKSASSSRLGRETTFDALKGKLSCRGAVHGSM